MMRLRQRGPFGLTFRRCLAVAALPTLLTAVAGTVVHAAAAPSLADEQNAPAASSPWLVLPLVTAAMSCSIAAVMFWPVIARHRPGAPWVERLQRGRLGGRGGAVAGALCAQWLLSLPLLTVLVVWFGAPSTAIARYELDVPPALLSASQPRLSFAAPPGATFREAWLRPRVGLPEGEMLATAVELRADGEPLGAELATFADTRRPVRVQFAPRAFARLELVRAGGTLPLMFAPGDVALVGATTHSNLANGVLAAAIVLLPAFVAMALACWLGLAAATPTVVAVVATAIFVQTIGGVGPQADAVMAVLRGHWLPAGPLIPRCAPSLAVGSFAMIVTMLLRPWARR